MILSLKEVLKAFTPLVDAGLEVGIMGVTDTEDCDYNVVYSKLMDFSKVVSGNEVLRGLPMSMNEETAYSDGCKTEEEMLEYVKKISAKALEIAKETNEPQIVDQIWPLQCKDPEEDCSWDILYEYITPAGEYQYMREHTY